MGSKLFKSVVALGAAGVVAAVAAYAVSRYQSPAPAGPTDKLNIAVYTGPHSALLYIAAAKGYFSEVGLEVTMLPAIHGKAAIDLVAQGKADLGTGGEAPFVLAVLEGEGLGIAANMLNSTSDMAVVARRDRGIATPRDLVGKKFGVTLGTGGEYFLLAFLIRHKLPTGSVTLVDMSPDQSVQELTKGTIDAMSSWHPNVFDAQLALGDNALTLYEPFAYTNTFNIIGRSDFLRRHSKAVEKLVRAMLKAERFNRTQPEEALNLLAGLLKVDVASLRPTWRVLNFRVDLLQSQLIALESQARWAMGRRPDTQAPIPNFLPHLYLDALLAVQPERVTVVR